MTVVMMGAEMNYKCLISWGYIWWNEMKSVSSWGDMRWNVCWNEGICVEMRCNLLTWVDICWNDPNQCLHEWIWDELIVNVGGQHVKCDELCLIEFTWLENCIYLRWFEFKWNKICVRMRWHDLIRDYLCGAMRCYVFVSDESSVITTGYGMKWVST